MKCTIHKNNLGKTTQVYTQNGEVSQLFNDMRRMPFVSTTEEAVTAVLVAEQKALLISNNPEDLTWTGEPKLYFQTLEVVTDSYKEALKTSSDGMIRVGFKGWKEDTFIPIMDTSSTLSDSSLTGIINNAILNDYLHEFRFTQGGESMLLGKGESIVESRISAAKVLQEINGLGEEQYTVNAQGYLVPANPEESTIPETKQEVDLGLADRIRGVINEYTPVIDMNNFEIRFNQELESIKEDAISKGTFMKAPNGEKSNLSESNWLKVRSKSFKDWFGDWENSPETSSKVVDKNGEPQIVYHGSNTFGFTSFDTGFTRDGGFFFSPNRQIANTYAKNNDNIDLSPITGSTEGFQSGVGEFFLNIRDPYEVDGYGRNWDDIVGYPADDLEIDLEVNDDGTVVFTDHKSKTHNFKNIDEAESNIRNKYGDYLAESLLDELRFGDNKVEILYLGDKTTGEEAPMARSTREWVEEAVSSEFEGVMFRDIDDNGPHGVSGTGDVYVAFYPTSIKAADNIGQFSSSNEDFRFSMSKDQAAPNENSTLQVLNPIITRLQENFDNKVHLHTTETLDEYLQDRKGITRSIDTSIKGFVDGKDVFLNTDQMTLDTPIHEFGHLWLNTAKTSNPGIFQRGINLIEKEGQEYIDYVKKTQPELEGDDILEEALAQAIGDSGAKFIGEQKKSDFKEWLNSLWDFIATSLGISEYSNEDIQNLSLVELSDAIAIELLKSETVAGALEADPGQGAKLNISKKELSSHKGISLDTSKYPKGEVVELPKMTLKEVIEKYKGKIYITTSDATIVSIVNGELVQGGPGYIAIKKNVEEGVGFAALDVRGAKTAGSKIFNIGQGDPVAVLIMVQTVSSTLGNGYGGDFLYDNIKKLENTLSEEEFDTFMASLSKVVDRFYEVNVKDIPRDNFFKSEHKPQVLNLLSNIKNVSLQEFHDVFINETNFNFKRNLMTHLVLEQNKKSKAESGVVKDMLRSVGATYEAFKEQYVDPNLIDLTPEQEGSVVAGFEVRTDFENLQAMGEYIESVQDKGVKHKMFNGKLPSEGSFTLDAAYGVNSNFEDYSKSEVILKKEFLTKINALIGKWNPKYEGMTYAQLKTGPSIAFKAFLAQKYPQYLTSSPSDVARDVARGLGFRQIENASERIYEDYISGIQYSKSENRSANTQDFFTSASQGEHAPNKPWSPLIKFSPEEQEFKDNFYDKHKGHFDDHIATNIPTFRENQIKVGSTIVDMFSEVEGALVYDIGGSEGGFVKAITEASNGNIRSINLDPNEQMQKIHNSTPVGGSTFIREAFYEGFEDGDITYKKHVPSEKADVVHEAMAFQFINERRDHFIKEAKDNYLKEDGILLLEEKITPDSENIWLKNEELKDNYKREYYSQEYIDKKRDVVLTGMKKNQTPYSTLLEDLRNEFTYVEEYWNAGNFKGVIATNSKDKLDSFLRNYGPKLEFNTNLNLTPNQQEFADKVKTGTWGMLTAENPNKVEASEVANYRANTRARAWLTDRGYKFTEIKGKYGNTENSYFVEGLTPEHALEFMKEFAQESVATNEGLLFNDGSVSERIEGGETFGGVYEDMYSTIEIDGQPLDFQVNYSRERILTEPMNETNSRNYPNMTEDGEGNFVFYHYSPIKSDTLVPGSKQRTAAEGSEVGTWSKVGGVVMFYTKTEDRENVVKGNYGYIVKIPKERVYDINSDRQGFYNQAEELFRIDNPYQAFDYNHQSAYISKVALDNGYLATVGEWNGTSRGHSLIPVTPVDYEQVESNKVVKSFEKEYTSNIKKGIRVSKKYSLKRGWFDILVDFDAMYAPKHFSSLFERRMNPGEVISTVLKSNIPESDKRALFTIAKTSFNRPDNFIPEAYRDQILQWLIDNEGLEYYCT